LFPSRCPVALGAASTATAPAALAGATFLIDLAGRFGFEVIFDQFGFDDLDVFEVAGVTARLLDRLALLDPGWWGGVAPFFNIARRALARRIERSWLLLGLAPGGGLLFGGWRLARWQAQLVGQLRPIGVGLRCWLLWLRRTLGSRLGRGALLRSVGFV